MSSVEVFDPATEEWSVGLELPNALCGAGKSGIVVAKGFDHNTSNDIIVDWCALPLCEHLSPAS